MADSVYRIAYVCLGNICRSPTAEGIMRALVKQQNLADRITVGSYGVGGWHVGEQPDRRAQATARGHGIELSSLRGEKVSEYHSDQWDLLLAMDRSVLHELRKMVKPSEVRTELFGNLLPKVDPMYGQDVPDPYYNDGFENVFAMIERGCRHWLAEYMSGNIL